MYFLSHDIQLSFALVSPIIKATILSNNTLDLDNPFHLQKFKKYQLELQAQLLETGIQLDFTKGKGFVEERTRCFWSDLIKEQYNIDVLIYTFTKRNPSYIENKYRIINNSKNPLNNIGLSYHEKQICVTKNSSIIDNIVAFIIEVESLLLYFLFCLFTLALAHHSARS